MYQCTFNKPQADFWGTRRWEGSGWFMLTGMVANQTDVDGSGTPPAGEYFRIGSKTSFSPKISGYLYCFANDAWRFYGNNRGSVLVTVTRENN